MAHIYATLSHLLWYTTFVSPKAKAANLTTTTTDLTRHHMDWCTLTPRYATLGHLAGYTPTDPKAGVAKLPPPDSIDVWPWIVGDVAQSPRTEVRA